MSYKDCSNMSTQWQIKQNINSWKQFKRKTGVIINWLRMICIYLTHVHWIPQVKLISNRINFMKSGTDSKIYYNNGMQI